MKRCQFSLDDVVCCECVNACACVHAHECVSMYIKLFLLRTHRQHLQLHIYSTTLLQFAIDEPWCLRLRLHPFFNSLIHCDVRRAASRSQCFMLFRINVAVERTDCLAQKCCVATNRPMCIVSAIKQRDERCAMMMNKT